MTESEAIRTYQSLSKAEQARILIRFAHWLTICARDTYVAGSREVADPPRLRALNELLHGITGKLRDLLDDAPLRYPDDFVAQWLYAAAQEARSGSEAELGRLLQGAAKPIKQPA